MWFLFLTTIIFPVLTFLQIAKTLLDKLSFIFILFNTNCIFTKPKTNKICFETVLFDFSVQSGGQLQLTVL